MSSYFPIDHGQPIAGGADKLTRSNFASLIAGKCVVSFFAYILRSASLAGTTPLAIKGEDSLPGVSTMSAARMDAPAEHINCHKTLIKSATF
jgi:hypothetical protein